MGLGNVRSNSSRHQARRCDGSEGLLVPEGDLELLGVGLGDHGVPGHRGAHHSVGGQQPPEPETSQARSLITKVNILNNACLFSSLKKVLRNSKR